MTLSMFKNDKYQKILAIASFVLLMLSVVLCLITNCWYGIKTTILRILPAMSLLCFILWLLSGRFKARPVYLLGFGVVLWFAATRIIIRDYYMSQPFYFFAEMLLIYCFAFPFAKCSDDFERRRFFDIFALFMVVVTAMACCIGIYCAMSGNYLFDETSKFFTGLDSSEFRLYIFGVIPTFSSVYMILSLLLSLYLLLRYWRPKLLIPMAFELVIFFWALALTGCRTVEICLYVCAAPVTGVLLAEFWKKKTKLRVPVIILAMLAAMVLSYALVQVSVSACNHMLASVNYQAETETVFAEQQTEEITAEAESTAAAETETVEESAPIQLEERELNYVSGRDRIINCVFSYLRDYPKVLAFGTSNMAIRIMSSYGTGAEQYYIKNYLHNAYLQILALLGIPGLVIAFVLLVLLCVSCLRILFSAKRKAEEKILPILLLVLVVDSLAESMIIVPFDVMANTFFNGFFFLVAGYVTELAQQCRQTD